LPCARRREAAAYIAEAKKRETRERHTAHAIAMPGRGKPKR
jgi:hypothetical protein